MTISTISVRRLAAVACLLLVGCTPAGSGSATPTSSSPASTPTPTSTPAVTPSPSPSPAQAEIDFDRFRDIYVGMSFAEASAASGIAVTGESMCPWFANIIDDDPTGLYVATTSWVDTPGDEILFFRMLWLDDPALAPAGLPRTTEGITIGSTVADVLAAYPSATLTTIDDMSRGARSFFLVAGPDDLTLIFDVQSGLVSEITWGKRLMYGPPGEMCAL
jgi:hypothetical protein